MAVLLVLVLLVPVVIVIPIGQSIGFAEKDFGYSYRTSRRSIFVVRMSR